MMPRRKLILKLEVDSYESISCDLEQAEIRFHMQKEWREIFSSYCVTWNGTEPRTIAIFWAQYWNHIRPTFRLGKNQRIICFSLNFQTKSAPQWHWHFNHSNKFSTYLHNIVSSKYSSRSGVNCNQLSQTNSNSNNCSTSKPFSMQLSSWAGLLLYLLVQVSVLTSWVPLEHYSKTLCLLLDRMPSWMASTELQPWLN